LLRGLNAGPALLALHGAELRHPILRREQESLDVGFQIAVNNPLATRTNSDDAVQSSMLAFVRHWPIMPNICGHVDVNAAHRADRQNRVGHPLSCLFFSSSVIHEPVIIASRTAFNFSGPKFLTGRSP
jgi:hypothetical protein